MQELKTIEYDWVKFGLKFVICLAVSLVSVILAYGSNIDFLKVDLAVFVSIITAFFKPTYK